MAASNQEFPVSVTLQQMLNDPNIVDDGSGPPVVELIVDAYDRIEGLVIEGILKRLPRVNKITLEPTDKRYGDVGSMVTHQYGLKVFAAEVLKSGLTITNLSMGFSGTMYFIGCIGELVNGKRINSLSMELDYTLPREIELIGFRAFLTKEDCPVTDLRIVIQRESTLAEFVRWFDSRPSNQTTRIKRLTLEQSKWTQSALKRFDWTLDFNKRGIYGTSTLASNIRVLVLKGFYMDKSIRSSLANYLLSQQHCKPLIAVCLVNIRSESDDNKIEDPSEEHIDGAAKVVKVIEKFVDSTKCQSTYKAISASNQQKTQHAYVLVKWVAPLAKASKIQLCFVNDLADKWKSFMTTLNNEFSLDCKTNELEFDVDKEIIELKHAAMQQALGVLRGEEWEEKPVEEPVSAKKRGRPSLSGKKRRRHTA